MNSGYQSRRESESGNDSVGFKTLLEVPAPEVPEEAG